MKNNVPLKKMKDVKFYLENFTKIKGKKVGNMIPFILNQAQVDLFNTVKKHSRTIILKARQIGFCQHPSTRVLTSDLEWVTLDNIKVGQSIVAVDEKIAGGKGSARKIQTAIVQGKSNVYSEAIKITLDNGSELTATPSHKFLFKDSHKCMMTWKRMDELKIGDETGIITKTWEDKTYEDGWFGGMIDGEGSLSKKSRTGVSLTVSQVSGYIWDRLVDYVENNNIKYRIEVDKRKAGDSSKLGSKEVNKVVISNMLDLIYIMGKTATSRFKDRKFWEGKRLGFTVRPKIIKIEKLEKQRMVDLQTSEHTYIAEGFISHNSTAMVGFFYHSTITNPGTTTALIGYNTDLTAELLDKVKTFFLTTPMELRPTIQYNSKHEISFPALNSKILVLPSTETVGRGYTLTNVLATELAFWEKADEKMYALEASVPLAGKLVIESTPNGQGNLYHRIWMTDNNDYAKNRYGWWWGYSREEIELIKRRMNNPLKFAQEYGCEFLASGRNVFDVNMIREQRKNQLKVGDVIDIDSETKHTVTEENGFRTYKEPEDGHFYVFGADVAEGVEGGDYSVAHVWDRATGEEVAMYRGLLPPDTFGEKLNKWGRRYNNALMTVEVNNHGLTTLTILKNLLYPTLYFRPVKYETLANPTSDKLGWKTTKVTRYILIDEFAQACRDGALTIHSKELLDEMSVFVYNDAGNMQPQETFHDDCIFAAGIGFQGFKVMYHKKLEQIDYQQFLPKTFSY